jgi:hypothetical protein
MDFSTSPCSLPIYVLEAVEFMVSPPFSVKSILFGLRRLRVVPISIQCCLKSVSLTFVSHLSFIESSYCSNEIDRNWSTLGKILRRIVPPDQLVMTCSTGKQRLWDQKTRRIQVVYSSWIFISQRTILSNHQKCTLRHVFIIATSTQMAVFV